VKRPTAPRQQTVKFPQGSVEYTPKPVFGAPGVVVDELLLLLLLLLLEELVVAQVGPVIVLASSVTVPADSAKTRPSRVAPVSRAVTPFCAIIVPINEVVVPKVAELPTRHHTLQGSPPVTDEPDDVMSVDTVLKIQTPDPVRVRFPLSEKLLVEQ
jgi:hypothetical protein